jgi:hypothetical protein
MCMCLCVCVCVFQKKFKKKVLPPPFEINWHFGEGKMTCSWYTFYVWNVNQKRSEGVYIDKQSEYDHNLVLSSQNILYIGPVKRSKKFRPRPGARHCSTCQCYLHGDNKLYKFCSLICKGSSFFPSHAYLNLCVCVCVFQKKFKNKYYHLRSELVDVLNMRDDMQLVHYLRPKCQKKYWRVYMLTNRRSTITTSSLIHKTYCI